MVCLAGVGIGGILLFLLRGRLLLRDILQHFGGPSVVEAVAICFGLLHVFVADAADRSGLVIGVVHGYMVDALGQVTIFCIDASQGRGYVAVTWNELAHELPPDHAQAVEVLHIPVGHLHVLQVDVFMQKVHGASLMHFFGEVFKRFG